MTTTELKAGRELDALVAVAVFGWAWWERSGHDGVVRKCLFPPDPDQRWNFHQAFRLAQESTPRFTDWERAGSGGISHYSTDPAAAWQVVEAMIAKGYTTVEIEWRGDKWTALVGPEAESKAGPGTKIGFGISPTMPEAVCRAALAAVGAP